MSGPRVHGRLRRGRSVPLRGLAATVTGVLLGLAVGAGTAAPAHAAFPGRDGRIAYDLPAGTASHIWTVNPDGTGKRRLTVDGRNKSPRWSADGRRIAFTRNKNVFVMNADGSGKRQITSLGRDLQPAWSPDGRHLVFIRLQTNGRGDLFRVPVAGGAVTRLTYDAATTGGNDAPTWSPRGGVVLFLQYGVSGSPGAVIKTVSVTTKVQRVVPAGVPVNGEDRVYDPDFTSDGRHVVFMARCVDAEFCYPANDNVMQADLTSPDRTPLTHWGGIGGEWEQPRGVAAAPSGGIVLEICDDYILGEDRFGFCGIRPGNVNGALNPDQQPLR